MVLDINPLERILESDSDGATEANHPHGDAVLPGLILVLLPLMARETSSSITKDHARP